jgi:hypothetical protein
VFGVFIVIWSVSKTQYGGLAPQKTEPGANAALAVGYLVPIGKDDLRGGYNPIKFNPMAKIYNSPPENLFKEIVQLDSNPLKRYI